MSQEPTDPPRRDAETHRYVVEAQIEALRPASLGVICTLLLTWGFAAAYTTFWLLAEALLPFRLPTSTFLAVLASCLVWVLVGFVLAWRLQRGSLWAWFGAVSATAVSSGGPILILVQRVQGGLSVLAAAALAPSHDVLVPLSLVLLTLLLRRNVRTWLATIRRLKVLPAAGVDTLVASARHPGGG
jgi:hypothetical protein